MSEKPHLYPVPENETDRLKSLRSYAILDSPPEVDFDALTRVAVNTFHVPIAVVGLMDSERLWFKSALGLEIPQLDRQIAFCAYSIMTPGRVLVIDDLQQDPRFRDNPLVTRPPYMRFYAGAPLVDPNGYVLGALGLVDIKPRTLNESERAMLYDLSLLAMTALESRRRSLLLTKLALTDYLTGVANRAQFDRALETEHAHARRTGEPFSVMCLDLNSFKDINDRFGHPAGDEVLCEVARRLQQQMRTEDTVSRIGGDEFGMVIREGSQTSAQTLAQRITQVMEKPVTLSSGEEVEVGISIGLATYTEMIESPYSLLAQADANLYASKRRSGKLR